MPNSKKVKLVRKDYPYPWTLAWSSEYIYFQVDPELGTSAAELEEDKANAIVESHGRILNLEVIKPKPAKKEVK